MAISTFSIDCTKFNSVYICFNLEDKFERKKIGGGKKLGVKNILPVTTNEMKSKRFKN